MFNQRILILTLIVIIFVSSIFFAGQYYVVLLDLQTQKSLLQTYQHNEKILSFTKLFITKVLKAESEVTFEDRLQLENAVRNINNKPIFDQWTKFTESKTEAQAQIEVKNLLELLINKITY